MKKPIIIAGILALLAVILGAFGAHGLKGHISDQNLEAFKTGQEYQFLHSLAILIIFAIHSLFPVKQFRYAVYFFLTGIFLFSGSLYLLSTRELTGLPVGLLGPVTPLGGLCFITGWLLFLIGFTRLKKEHT